MLPAEADLDGRTFLERVTSGTENLREIQVADTHRYDCGSSTLPKSRHLSGQAVWLAIRPSVQADEFLADDKVDQAS